MNIWWALARPLGRQAKPPAGGFTDGLPGAFGAKNKDGKVFVIGYMGEWYHVKRRPVAWLHNWLISRGNMKDLREHG